MIDQINARSTELDAWRQWKNWMQTKLITELKIGNKIKVTYVDTGVIGDLCKAYHHYNCICGGKHE